MMGFSISLIIILTNGDSSKKLRSETVKKRRAAIVLFIHCGASEKSLSFLYNTKAYRAPSNKQKMRNHKGCSVINSIGHRCRLKKIVFNNIPVSIDKFCSKDSKQVLIKNPKQFFRIKLYYLKIKVKFGIHPQEN